MPFHTREGKNVLPGQSDCSVITRSELNRQLRRFSRIRKLGLCRSLFSGRQEVRRDFVLFDTAWYPGFHSEAALLHLPSMLWRGLNLSFEQALKLLDDPDHDKELIRGIYEVASPKTKHHA